MRQTDPDFEHIMIEDERGHGIHWANQQIMYTAEFVKGRYVYILDDDDFLITENFISGLRAVVDSCDTPPEVIFVKGYINLSPMPKYWQSFPVRGCIGSPNFIVRTDVFQRHAKAWDVKRAGDYNFINSVMSPGCSQFWWDKLVFYADASCGMTEGEKRRALEEMLRRAGHA